MEEISIVRRRSRLWPIVLAVLVLAAVVLAALWFIGSRPAADIGWHDPVRHQLIDIDERRHLGAA